MSQVTRVGLLFYVLLHVLVCLGGTGCVATPVPIPIPIESGEVRLSGAAGGRAAVVGLAGSTNGPAVVVVTNEATGEQTSGPVTARGTFAVVVAAWPGDTLRLHTELDGKTSAETTTIVGVAGAELWGAARVSSRRADGTVQVTWDSMSLPFAIVAVERTGQVAVLERAPVSKGAPPQDYAVTVSAELDDRIHVFFSDGAGRSTEHGTVVVTAPGAVPPCQDADGDGYGAPNTDRSGCTNALSDCNDDERDVHPEQSQFYPMAIFRAPAAQDYDYDCDGEETVEQGGVLACEAAQVCDGEGWLGTLPACGDEGTWARCVMEKTCVAREEGPRRQGCR